jgi:uncharacterized surface protein with fasciclin (FAS1) repeats
MRPKHMGVTVAAVGLGLAAAACGSSGSASSNDAVNVHHVSVTTGTVGAGCDQMPKSGTGSVSGMADVPVTTAAARDPQLSYAVRAIEAAGLAGTLDSAKSITVFAPDNSAFIALGTKNVQRLESSKTDLRDVLEYHLVDGRLTPADLATRKSLTTRLGLPLHPVVTGTTYEVNGAKVVCGNIKTANATIYVIDKVLLPTQS